MMIDLLEFVVFLCFLLGVCIGCIVFFVVVGFVVIVVVVVFFVIWMIQWLFLQMVGFLEFDGLQVVVMVQCDDCGILIIIVDFIDDFFYVEGFVYVQDWFFEMDFCCYVMVGWVVEMFGELQVGIDVFFCIFGWCKVVEVEVEVMDEMMFSYYEVYVVGVNVYFVL